MTPAQKHLARWLLDNPEEGSRLSARAVALRSGSSAPSAVRFARVLGYDGFRAMQRALVSDQDLTLRASSGGSGGLVAPQRSSGELEAPQLPANLVDTVSSGRAGSGSSEEHAASREDAGRSTPRVEMLRPLHRSSSYQHRLAAADSDAAESEAQALREPLVKYSILGPVTMRSPYGPTVPLGGPRQIALLALLLLNAHTWISSDRLIDALWDDDARGADKRLQMAIARLRKVVDADGPVLHTTGGGYMLAVAPGELDAHVFEDLIADGRTAFARGDAERASTVLTQALKLWRGTPFADVSYMDFAQPEIRRLEEMRLGAIETCGDADLALGRHAELVGPLEAVVAEYPTRERMAGQLMMSLYRCGRQADALDIYQRTRTHLVQELGLDPGPALQALQAEILDQSPALGAPAAPTAVGRTSVPVLLARLGRKRLVGRDDVLDKLMQAWEETVASREQRIVLLAGPPGIGKTSLTAHMACDVATQKATVLYGRADAGELFPLQPFVDALRHLVQHAELSFLQSTTADLAELSCLMPELSQRLPELRRPVEMAGGDEQYKLFSAVAGLLVGAAARAPVLLALDDLDWADAPALQLLSHLARYSERVPLLILGIYRDTDLSHAPQLADTLIDLNREHLVERIVLGGLDELAVGELIAGLTEAAPKDLTPILLQKTGGNPFYIVEILRDLVESGALVNSAVQSDRSAGSLLARIGVPEGVRQLVERQLARLDVATREALMLASVLGVRFDLGGLAAVAERPTKELVGALDEALVAGLLREVPGTSATYEFSHELVRETLYRRPSAARRERLHSAGHD